jgi:hypothetical protein
MADAACVLFPTVHTDAKSLRDFQQVAPDWHTHFPVRLLHIPGVDHVLSMRGCEH